MFKEEIIKALQRATSEKDIQVEFPENEEHGDYSTNVAMLIAKRQNKSPLEVARKIVSKLQKDSTLTGTTDRIEVAGGGFINFFLNREYLLKKLEEIVSKKEKFGRSSILQGKIFLIEHTSPNTVKTLHIGHVRNNVLGMTLHNLFEAIGAKVTMDAINNDRGIHVMKAVWAYLKYGHGRTPQSENKKPDHFVDKFYRMGVKAERDEKIKKKMQELLRRWEAGDEKVRAIWKKLRDWTYAGFLETYKRLGSLHDYQWFESDFYEEGKKIVLEGLKKGIFRRLDDGAVLSDLSKYNLPDTIILRADGTTMYHTQDLRLTQLKREKFPSDKYFWVIGPEQTLYLKQLFAMAEKLGIGKREDYEHIAYGFVYLKGRGKMSSRAGNVISADWLMDRVVAKAKSIIEKSETSRGLGEEEKQDVAEAAGIGAIKYSFLKVARLTDIYFDIDESLALEGNSSPYLQYTYARTQSIMAKSKIQNPNVNNLKIENWKLKTEEELVIRLLSRFPEIIIDAAKNYSPNLLCNYLFSLAQKYNTFYNSFRIVNAPEGQESENFRLLLSKSVGQVIKNGLELLGIKTPERM